MATKAAASEIKNVVPEYDPEEMVDIKLFKDAKNYKRPGLCRSKRQNVSC